MRFLQDGLACLLFIAVITFLSGVSHAQKALHFNNDDGYISFGEPPELDVKNITIEAWIKLDEAKPGVIMAKPGAYYFRVLDQLILETGIYDNGTDENWHIICGSTVLDLDEFYHVAFTFDGSDLVLYLNGRIEKTSKYTGSIDPFLTNGVYAGNQLFIDDYEDYNSSTEDTKIYIHENYSTHKPPTAVQKIDTKKNRYHFSGDNDIDNVADEAISYIKGLEFLDYIIEVDERWSQQEGNAYISQRFLDVRDKYEIAIDPEWNQIWLNKVVENVWTPITTSTQIPRINNDTWYTIRSKISTVGSTNNIKAWINGIQYIEANDPDLHYDSLAILVHDHDAEDFSYDIYFDNLQVFVPFKGVIDELRIFDTAVSQADILTWMCRLADNTHVNWSNLQGYWRFDDAADPTEDYSANSNSGNVVNVAFVDSKIPSGYTNNFVLGNAGITETADVLVDLIWGDDGPGTNAIINIIQINDPPKVTDGLSGTYPALYWEVFVDNNDGSFKAEIHFHYDGIDGISDESKLTLYSRTGTGHRWSVVPGFTIVHEGNKRDGIGYITAKNTAGFAQYILTYRLPR